MTQITLEQIKRHFSGAQDNDVSVLINSMAKISWDHKRTNGLDPWELLLPATRNKWREKQAAALRALIEVTTP